MGHGTGFISIYVPCHLKNYFSFKNKCAITSMGLIADNKKFLQLITSSPGTTYDARLLRDSTLSKDIQSGGTVPNKSIILRDFGEVPLV